MSEPGSDHGTFSPGNEAGIDPAWVEIDALDERIRRGLTWAPHPWQQEGREALDALVERAKQAEARADNLTPYVNRYLAAHDALRRIRRLPVTDPMAYTEEDTAVVIAREALAGKETTEWDGDASSFGCGPYTPNERALGYGTPEDPRMKETTT